MGGCFDHRERCDGHPPLLTGIALRNTDAGIREMAGVFLREPTPRPIPMIAPIKRFGSR